MHAFRNVLVHRCGKLDGALVFANMRRAPADFRQMGRAFRTALDHWGGR